MGGLVDTVDHKLDEPQTVRGHDGTVNRTLFHQFVRRKRLSSSYSGRTGSLVITILMDVRARDRDRANISHRHSLVEMKVDRVRANHSLWLTDGLCPKESLSC